MIAVGTVPEVSSRMGIEDEMVGGLCRRKEYVSICVRVN